jgi:hypothetical protein
MHIGLLSHHTWGHVDRQRGYGRDELKASVIRISGTPNLILVRELVQVGHSCVHGRPPVLSSPSPYGFMRNARRDTVHVHLFNYKTTENNDITRVRQRQEKTKPQELRGGPGDIRNGSNKIYKSTKAKRGTCRPTPSVAEPVGRSSPCCGLQTPG